MTRLHCNTVKGFLLAFLWTCVSSAAASVPFSESTPDRSEPDSVEQVKSRQEQILRAAGNDQEQPVDWTCGDQSGAQSPADGPAVSDVFCDGSFVQIVDAPAGAFMTLDKGSNTLSVDAPGPVFYSYVVTNIGAFKLTSIALSDNHVDAPPTCPQTMLTPGQSMVCDAVYTVTAVDINNFGSPVPGSGLLENTASVFAAEGASASDNLQIPFAPQTGSLTMDKNSPVMVVTEPGPVAYTYLITNTGGVALNGFEISDDHVDAPVACPLFTLNPGESMSCTATYTVTQADIENLGSPVPDSGFLTNNADVTTNEGPAAADSHQIPIIEDTPSGPLVLLPQGSSIGVVQAGEPYEFTFTAVGGEPPILFSGSGAPSGLGFTQDASTFTLSGIPQETGQFIITVSAVDSAEIPNETSRIYSLRVEGEPEPVLPTLPAAMLPDAIEGQPYEFGLEIAGGTPPFEFSADGLPQGLGFNLDGNLLTLSGTATESGDFVLNVSVTDSADPIQSTSRSYDLRVVPELELLPSGPQLGFIQVDAASEIRFRSQGGQTPVALSGDNAPPGLQFDQSGADLVLSGTPTTIGEYTFTVSATDSMTPPQMVEREYFIAVVLALDIQPEVLADAIVGNDYLAVLSVQNGIPPYAFDLTGLPAGLTLIGSSITGNPSQSGSYTLAAAVSDAAGNTGSRDLLLEVRSAGDVMVGETLPDAYLNTGYGYQLKADGASAPVSWSGGGGLPPGFVLESTGLVNGMAQQTGPFSFSATANAADGNSYPGNFNVTVLDSELITANAGFPSGLTGVPYRSPTAIRGGSAPFDCEVISGALPPGLDLNGCNEGIDGTPTAPGSYPFSLGVMDSGSPELVAEIDGIIQVAATTPVPDPLPPDLNFLPPLNIPVSELSVQSPDTGFPDETLQGLAVDDWGNRYVVGFSYNGSDYDIRALKFSADGTLLWDQVYDSGNHDYGYGIAVSATRQAVYVSGYSLVGNVYQAVLIRYDLVGVEQWAVNNDSNSQVTAYYGLAADDDGVYAIGERYNGSHFDALATRYSHTGTLAWENILSTTSTRTGYAITRSECGNATCLLAGGADGESNRSGWVVRLQAGTGAATPLATVPSAPVYALQRTDNGFAAAGSSDTDDWFISAYGTGGQSQWNISLTSGDNLRGLARDRNGYLYAAGSGNAGSDGMVALISPDGAIEETRLYDIGTSEVFRGIAVGPDGMVTTAGQRSDATGNRFLIVDFNTGKAN